MSHFCRCVEFRLCLYLALPIIAAGCSAAVEGPPFVPVEGTVLLDSKPLSGAEVTFEPQGDTPGHLALFGRTDAAGKFSLHTPDGKRTGAAVGEYKVVVNKLVRPDGSDFIPDPNSGPMDTGGFREVLPVSYSDTAQSQLTATVPDGGTKTLEFKLKSKGR
jgi:hypothetical protein